MADILLLHDEIVFYTVSDVKIVDYAIARQHILAMKLIYSFCGRISRSCTTNPSSLNYCLRIHNPLSRIRSPSC
jgi:hypothetical protein